MYDSDETPEETQLIDEVLTVVVVEGALSRTCRSWVDNDRWRRWCVPAVSFGNRGHFVVAALGGGKVRQR